MERGFKLNEDVVEKSIAELSDEFAQRVGALADLFERWREPEVARKVIESTLADDGAAFRDLVDLDLPVPPLDKCVWVAEVIEKVVALVPTTEVCRVRVLLSPDERRLLIAIILEFRRRGELPVFDSSGGIPPGLFLEALREADLVTCVTESVGGGLEQVLGKPSRHCV